MEVMKLQQDKRDGVSLIVFSGEMDRMLAAFTIALGAAAAGSPVTMFFTFWGLNLLRRKRITAKLLPQKMLQALQAPGGSRRPLSTSSPPTQAQLCIGDWQPRGVSPPQIGMFTIRVTPSISRKG